MGALFSIVADFLVGIFKTMFTKSRDETLGKLEVTDHDKTNELTDIQKAQAARAADNSKLNDSLCSKD